MQYGAELYPYKRVESLNKNISEEKKINENKIYRLLTYLVFAFLITRVVLINHMAPFGIAFLLAAIFKEESKIPFVPACGILLGYISLCNNNIDNLGAYFLVLATILIIDYMFINLDFKNRMLINMIVLFVEFLLYGLLLGNELWESILISILELISIVAAYYIISYSMTSFDEIKTKHIFIKEETICMAITASLAIAGTGFIVYKGISIRNIIALLFIVVIAYIEGNEKGAAMGIILGTIVGITSNSSNVITLIAIYGVCGLVVGTFRDSGKLWSGLACVITSISINLYSNIQFNTSLIEILVVFGIFITIPSNIYEKLTILLDFDNRQNYSKQDYTSKIKNIIFTRSKNFSSAIRIIPDVLKRLSDNDKLEMKDRSACLVENLADRVCSGCSLNSVCWKRESYYTYSAFSELIGSYQQGKNDVPYEIEKKCIKKMALINNMQEVVSSYVSCEVYKRKALEFKALFSGEMENIAKSVDDIIYNADDIVFDNILEDNIKRHLRKSHISFREVLCYKNKSDKLNISVILNQCDEKQICVKSILPIINEISKKCMCVSTEGCNIEEETDMCRVNFEETPKFHVATYVNKICKFGEQFSGDNVCHEKLNDGNYILVLSDGMGSGPKACEESSAAVEMIESFSKAGFRGVDAINIVNSVLSMRYSEEEKFCTMDINNIDLYKGISSMIKIGSSSSFVKRGNNVEVISSNNLPIGVIDKLEIEVIEKNLFNGDIIVMVSDGILDYSNEVLGKADWVTEYLQKTDCTDPKELSSKLIERALELNGGKAKDDMTVVISKIYSIC